MILRSLITALWMATALPGAETAAPQFSPESRDFLLQLLATPSPSTREEKAQQLWLSRISPHADSTGTDAAGNAWAEFRSLKKGAPSIVIAAHIDEVGLEVAEVTPRGFIKVRLLGHPDGTSVLSVPYILHSEKGPVQAFAGNSPSWWLDTQDQNAAQQDIPVEDMLALIHTELSEQGKSYDLSFFDRMAMRKSYANALKDPKQKGRAHLIPWCGVEFDVGADTAEQVKDMGIVPGTLCVPAVKPEIRAGHRLVAHGLDDRLHSFLMTELASYLAAHRDKLEYNIVLLSTTCEEIGLLGAYAYGKNHYVPLSVILDCTVDTRQLKEAKDLSPVAMGAGPVLQAYPGTLLANTNWKYDLGLNHALLASAEEQGIAIQQEKAKSPGLSDFVPFMGQGGRSTMIGCAVRYMHSPHEMADLRDAAGLLGILQHFLTTPPSRAILGKSSAGKNANTVK